MNPSIGTATPVDAFLLDVQSGLSKSQKTLSCKYLYDQRGSELFDKICETDEYYPTRTELQIMERNADSIADQIGSRVMLVEYGSGSSIKTRVLLDALDTPVAYVPVDISEDHLLRTAKGLQTAYPETEILPVVADFTQPFSLPQSNQDYSHVAIYFPGSTIGNFTPEAAGELLQFMSSILGPQGGLLIGIDLQKEVSVIESAYNDQAGITSDFNLNLLSRINSELDGDFRLDEFKHQAVYNSDQHRIEISIVSQRDQQVRIGGTTFSFRKGETIRTEYSHKYTIDGFAEFASQYGFALHKHWTDSRDYFGVLHLVLD
ncbi:Histidine-specific methyltransferase EgtD [Rubripirellula lacrimiformis]|uniref:Histidine-specific methyltransferase EgtD n=1 Tax=Rubripirellula lacrimiformis TaxID=1930273 RepID=A0A517NIB5_9BACT|nr:L-histidine N(alpha)-methyltransferase [Rubripirellula lacrimiformis]QDT06875.1 Histidine-specific methyltransferase EgtD [Rubripirellula lacrimiformis]